MITDYASLVSAVAQKAKRPDIDMDITQSIALAEDHFNSMLRTPQMEQRSTATDAASLPFPTDFLELRNVRLNTDPVAPMEYVTPQYADEFYGTSQTDRPIVYTIQANQLFFYPAPDSGYTVEIDYYQKIPALSGTNTTNWLLSRYPRLYLYATLAELLSLDEPQKAAEAARIRDALCERVQIEADNANFSGAPQYMRPMVQIA